MAAEKRRAQRVNANIVVKLRLPNGETASAEHIRNISLGGVFIAMADPLAFGSELALEFQLPAAPKVVRCGGFVTWSTKTSPERMKENGPGIGVRLTDIGIADMRRLAQFIEDWMEL